MLKTQIEPNGLITKEVNRLLSFAWTERQTVRRIPDKSRDNKA